VLSTISRQYEWKKLAAILWGLASSLAFAPLHLIPLFCWGLHRLLATLEKDANLTGAFWHGWLFGCGYFLGNCYWLYYPITLERHWLAPLLAPFIMLMAVAFLALHIGFAALLTASCRKIFPGKFFCTLIFSLCWVLLEYGKEFLSLGFPWNPVGYTLAFATPLLQLVSIGGSHIFGFWTLLLYSSPHVLEKHHRRQYIYYGLLLLIPLAFGLGRLALAPTEPPRLHLRLVQPHISLRDKIDQDHDDEILQKLLALSSLEDQKTYPVVWPETAAPGLFSTHQQPAYYPQLLQKLGNSKILLTGAIRLETNTSHIYNSLLIIGNNGILDYYDKYHLAPFGEFIPLKTFFFQTISLNFLPLPHTLRIKILRILEQYEDFTRANQRHKLLNPGHNLPSLSPLICYEALFTGAANRNAKFLLNITNDDWLGHAGPFHQHWSALKFRALETHRSVLRVANSGISGVIDAYGRVLVKTKIGIPTVLDVEVPLY
jgi:apolipoprotein N-acyltransferase